MSRMLGVTAQGYHKWLRNQSKPYKHAVLLGQMQAIINEDEENENYGIERMFKALQIKYDYQGSKSKVARVMRENHLTHVIIHKPNGLTKSDKQAQKSDNLLNRDFKSDAPNKKCVTDITCLPTADGILYISGIFDCFDNSIIGLAMDNNMRKELVIKTVEQAVNQYGASGMILHSDRGSQYTSAEYRSCLKKLGVIQSMNSAGGRCHDNAKCESMWARAKVEKFYKVNTSKLPMEVVKSLAFKYFMGYWNNRRICSANGGLPPAEKRRLYFLLDNAA